MNNMDLYNKVRAVPQEAQKPIAGGRLRGKTDINPMWRIAELTNNFGPCGSGWWYTIDRQWIESYNDQVAAFVNITLYTKDYPKGIPGTGGSMFVELEAKGPYVSDECYKMALTDALSVACKALGFGADIYWQHGGKYGLKPTPFKHACDDCKKEIVAVKTAKGVDYTPEQIIEGTKEKYNATLCWDCAAKHAQQAKK